MRKPKKEWRKTTIEVEGSGRFPFDMLRYDNCVVRDSSLIEGRERRTLILTRFSLDGGPATNGRWSSFGWHVRLDSAMGDLV
jgi:hypothetical protein